MLESKCKCTYPPTYNSSSPDNLEGSVFILRFCLKFLTFWICSRSRLLSKSGESAIDVDVDVDVATLIEQTLCNLEIASQTISNPRLLPASNALAKRGSVCNQDQVIRYYWYAVSRVSFFKLVSTFRKFQIVLLLFHPALPVKYRHRNYRSFTRRICLRPNFKFSLKTSSNAIESR